MTCFCQIFLNAYRRLMYGAPMTVLPGRWRNVGRGRVDAVVTILPTTTTTPTYMNKKLEKKWDQYEGKWRRTFDRSSPLREKTLRDPLTGEQYPFQGLYNL